MVGIGKQSACGKIGCLFNDYDYLRLYKDIGHQTALRERFLKRFCLIQTPLSLTEAAVKRMGLRIRLEKC